MHLTDLALFSLADCVAIPILFRDILRQVRFPCLTTLELSLNMGASDVIDEDSEIDNPEGLHEFQLELDVPEHYALLPDVACRLKQVTVKFEDISPEDLVKMDDFLPLFGAANRDSVMNIIWDGLPLCPHVYRQKFLNDQVVSRMEEVPSCSCESDTSALQAPDS
jgi:hypothetical protein